MPDPTNTTDAADFDALLNDLLAVRAQLLAAAAEPDATAKALLALIGGAHLSCFASAARAWRDLARIPHRYRQLLEPGLHAGAPAPAALIDATRGYLRELGETLDREARRLQTELSAIETTAWTLGESTLDKPQRFARIKP
ncbi:MAG: hypothetical protein U1F68_09415 [Gammaproteobacteria bacterium]